MVSSSGSNMMQSREGLPPEAQNESERCVTSEMTPKKPKWLPEDWEMEVRTRRSGKSAGMKDRNPNDFTVSNFCILGVWFVTFKIKFLNFLRMRIASYFQLIA
ncbi:hypothetical protein AAC387_Pa01g1963 [Persea americana]